MKKITFAFLTSVMMIGTLFSQSSYNNLNIPLNDGSTSSFRAPNGTSGHASQRSVMFIHEWELLPMTSSTFSRIVFQYSGGATIPVTGVFTLWLQNTNDQDYLKANAGFSAITATMSTAYVGNFTVPGAAGNVSLTLTTPFNYTGGGLYVAWDFASTGPFATSPATITSNSSPYWIYFSASPGAAVNTFTYGNVFRPALLFSAINTSTNELRTTRIQTEGKVSRLENTNQRAIVTVVNSGFNAQSNVTVALNAAGANPYTGSVVIPTLPAGAVANVTFAAYPIPASGLSTLTGVVAGSSDQNISNNTKALTQSVSCGYVSLNQPTISTSDFFGSTTVGNGVITSFVHVTGAGSSSLTGVNVVIPSFVPANTGAKVYPVLSDASGNVIATGNTLTIGAANLDVVQPLLFSSPVNLTPNTVYLFGVGTTTSGYFPVGGIELNNIVSGYYFTPIGGGTPVPNLFGIFSLEATMLFPATNILVTATPTAACKNTPTSVTLTANGASGTTGYVWSTAGTGSTVVITSPSANTVYTVTGLNGTCLGAGSLNFNVVNSAITASSSNSIICRGRTATLTAVGASTYSWSSITGTTSIVTVTPNSSTQYTVFGTEPTLGCKSNNVVITVSVNACLGIAVNGSKFSDINIFPNPASNGKSEISGLTGVNTITIYNLLGQAVLTEKTERETFILDFSNQPNGTYLVKISDANNDSKIVKIINQN